MNLLVNLGSIFGGFFLGNLASNIWVEIQIFSYKFFLNFGLFLGVEFSVFGPKVLGVLQFSRFRLNFWWFFFNILGLCFDLGG